MIKIVELASLVMRGYWSSPTPQYIILLGKYYNPLYGLLLIILELLAKSAFIQNGVVVARVIFVLEIIGV